MSSMRYLLAKRKCKITSECLYQLSRATLLQYNIKTNRFVGGYRTQDWQHQKPLFVSQLLLCVSTQVDINRKQFQKWKERVN